MLLDKNIEVFVMYITFFSFSLILIHLAKKIKIALLLTEKVTISNKYLDFINIFLKKKVLVFLIITKLN